MTMRNSEQTVHERYNLPKSCMISPVGNANRLINRDFLRLLNFTVSFIPSNGVPIGKQLNRKKHRAQFE